LRYRNSAKEPYISATEPYIHTERPYISAKEPYISAKEPYISTKEPYISADIFGSGKHIHGSGKHLLPASSRFKALGVTAYEEDKAEYASQSHELLRLCVWDTCCVCMCV